MLTDAIDQGRRIGGAEHQDVCEHPLLSKHMSSLRHQRHFEAMQFLTLPHSSIRGIAPDSDQSPLLEYHLAS